MLASRLLRNAARTPALRSLASPHAAQPRVRLAIGAYRRNSQLPAGASASSPTPSASKAPDAPSLSSPASPSPADSPDTAAPVQRLNQDPLEPRLSLTFTCTAPNCSERSSHTFTKQAYEKGVVLVQCPGCKNRCVFTRAQNLPSAHVQGRHLIADNLHWFDDSTEQGKMRNIEDIMKARGEKVKRGIKIGEGEGGVLEMTE